ncbi:MAG TPA: sulfotransferase family 2 domain-containing protein [Candidatus Sulfotelmatobacter sp.]|nr:sulfotransferase family 2 domain-containing protein [Candidatus Sulfotelmatobacter sp.]
MIVSHRYRFVLLVPWKCASSTVWTRLVAYDESEHERFYDFNAALQRVVHRHLTLADYRALPEASLGYFTAAFVRNPYDRAYSGFRQLLRDRDQQPLVPFRTPWVRSLVVRQLSENAAQLIAAGYDFDAWMASLEEHQVYEIGRNSSLPLHPAHYWTHYAGAQAVDFVGRVEEFEADFELLCRRLGIPIPERTSANVDVAPFPLRPGDYKYTSRMNSASIRRINELFRDDFELLGYPVVSP